MALGRQVRSGHVFLWDGYALARFLQPTAMNARRNPVHPENPVNPVNPVPLDESTNLSVLLNLSTFSDCLCWSFLDWVHKSLVEWMFFLFLNRH